MSNRNRNADSFDIANIIAGILFATLVILKLFNFTKISWLWVLSPLWVPIVLLVALAILLAAVSLVIIVIVSIVAIVCQITEAHENRMRNKNNENGDN